MTGRVSAGELCLLPGLTTKAPWLLCPSCLSGPVQAAGVEIGMLLIKVNGIDVSGTPPQKALRSSRIRAIFIEEQNKRGAVTLHFIQPPAAGDAGEEEGGDSSGDEVVFMGTGSAGQNRARQCGGPRSKAKRAKQ